MAFCTIASPAKADDTGVSPDQSQTIEEPPLTSDQIAENLEKDRLTDLWAEFYRTGVVTPELLLSKPPGGEGNGSDYAMAAAANMTILRQQTDHTCGPASLRNMVRVMNKVRNGEYNAPTEETLATWTATEPGGTAIGNIKAALNVHFGRFGHWRLADPPDRQAYLARIAVDTYQYKQPLIQGVDTQYLRYYNGKQLNHFTFLYGFDTEQGDGQPNMVYIGDVFDPIFLYGSSNYGNPYGHHKEQLDNSFRANDRSGPYYDEQHPDAPNPRLIV